MQSLSINQSINQSISFYRIYFLFLFLSFPFIILFFLISYWFVMIVFDFCFWILFEISSEIAEVFFLFFFRSFCQKMSLFTTLGFFWWFYWHFFFPKSFLFPLWLFFLKLLNLFGFANFSFAFFLILVLSASYLHSFF